MCLLLLYLSIWNTILAWMFRYTHTCIVSVIEWTQSPHFNIYSYVHMRSISVLFAVLLLCCCVAVLVLVLSLCQLNSVQLGVYFTYYSTESKMCVLIACVSCSQSMYWCHMILLSLYWYSDHDTVLPYTLLRRTQLKHMKTRSDLCVVFGAFR